MKTLFACSLLFFTTVYLSFGQATRPTLTNDSDFRQSLQKLVLYPKTAQEEGKVARVYVDFKIDDQGRIINVTFLNKNTVDASFIKVISDLMEQLPAQKPDYVGEYILPIAFILDSKQGGVSQPTEVDRADFDRIFAQLAHTKSLLNELSVTGYTE